MVFILQRLKYFFLHYRFYWDVLNEIYGKTLGNQVLDSDSFPAAGKLLVQVHLLTGSFPGLPWKHLDIYSVLVSKEDHRMTEYTELKGKHKYYRVQLLALQKIISKTHTTCLKVLSENFFDALRLWHCDHFTGEPVLLPPILWVKNLFLIYNLNLP